MSYYMISLDKNDSVREIKRYSISERYFIIEHELTGNVLYKLSGPWPPSKSPSRLLFEAVLRLPKT